MTGAASSCEPGAARAGAGPLGGGAECLGRWYLIFPAFTIRKETQLSAGKRGWGKLDRRPEDSAKQWDKR